MIKTIPLQKTNSYKYKFLIIFIAIFINGSYIYISPYLSVLRLKAAIDNSDIKKTDKYLDFNSIRSDLKKQIYYSLLTSKNKELSSSPISEMGKILTSPIFNKIIDISLNATITPSGLAVLFSEGKLIRHRKKNLHKGSKIVSRYKDVKFKLYYSSLNTFILRSKIKGIDDPILAIWRRNGLAGWKVKSIKLPTNLINKIESNGLN